MDEVIEEQFIKEYGKKLTDEIHKGFVPKYTTIRCNIDKFIVMNILDENKIEYEEVNNNPYALVIINCKENDIKKLDLYKEGKIYLQSLSSQLPPLFMKINDKDQVLDMCAAPGGKTTELSMLYPSSLITACEMSKIRCLRLEYNINKQNVNNVTVMNTDGSKLSEYMSFDAILLDAPCSGSGTITGPCHIFEDGFGPLLDIQEKLLKKAISLLKKDKYMVYSTCSLFKEENEEQIKKVLSDDIEIVPINIDGVELLPSTIDGVLTIKPNNYYEGFFIALLHKKC